MKIEFDFLGDSSIYTKRPNKKKSWISQELQWMLREKLQDNAYCGGGAKEFQTYLQEGLRFDALGICDIGGEHTNKSSMAFAYVRCQSRPKAKSLRCSRLCSDCWGNMWRNECFSS